MPLDLTLIIPCHNDHRLLERLVQHIALLELARAVIIVDDGSTPALSLDSLADLYDPSALQISLLRQDVAQGAGAARNLALPAVETTHVMFMDADDLPTRELPGLCAALEGQTFDFCLFQHHDSRMNPERQWGQMAFDQMFWEQAGALHHGTAPVLRSGALHLVQTANYPWNKIYRTAFLRDHDIRCSPTRVHNDIELHWRSFFHADTILSSDHVAMIHFVGQDGTRITNRRSEDRLDVFIPLNRLGEELTDPKLAAFRTVFFRFSLGLLLWVKQNLQPTFHPALYAAADQFIAAHLPQNSMSELRVQAPDLLQQVQQELGLSLS